MERAQIKTLGELKNSGYQPRTIKQEIRNNLIANLETGMPTFQGILGYDDTVIPDVERALLSRHNILFLGLRGQAKTRLARQMIHLLNEWTPFVTGSELFDDPIHPISTYAQEVISKNGDATPIEWLHRSERYGEKLATPDVSVADLIGDLDPIKAANLRLSFADERVIHYGIIPRSNRGIFVINELPDLQARIQVALFNILQEGDIQIRGFKLRLPLDILFVFTANPEDYTNRGSIVTPLKDRIESQIITHYPRTIEVSRAITEQEADILSEQKSRVKVPELCKLLVEQIAMEARNSEFVDQKSGISARMTISAFENLIATAERRSLLEKTSSTILRISDFVGVLPSITGKIELVYEGEQEGPANVAQRLLGLAIRSIFIQYFPNPQTLRKTSTGKDPESVNPYEAIIDWFGNGNELAMTHDLSDTAYLERLGMVDGLEATVKRFHPGLPTDEAGLIMEFLLHGLAEYSLISKKVIDVTGISFGDILGSMFNLDFGNTEDE